MMARPDATPRLAKALAVLTCIMMSGPAIAGDGSYTVHEVSVEKGAVAGETDTIRIGEGERVILRWRTDQPLDLHLHGYDIRTEAVPDRPVDMPFEAHATGRFPVTSHAIDGVHRTLLYVEIHPR